MSPPPRDRKNHWITLQIAKKVSAKGLFADFRAAVANSRALAAWADGGRRLAPRGGAFTGGGQPKNDPMGRRLPKDAPTCGGQPHWRRATQGRLHRWRAAEGWPYGLRAGLPHVPKATHMGRPTGGRRPKAANVIVGCQLDAVKLCALLWA